MSAAIESADQLLPAAVELARSLASKARPNRAQIKETPYERDTRLAAHTDRRLSQDARLTQGEPS